MSEYEYIGRYFYRGGKKIDLEKEEEFFTCYLKDNQQLESIRALPGVKQVKPVQNKIFKIQVSASERDAVMHRCRSKDIGTVCHHAYKPAYATSTRYYLSDQIIAKFKAGLSDQDVERLLREDGLRLVKEYPGNASMLLLQVTSTAGKNPIKVANMLAQRSEVEWAEPNLINRFQKFYTPMDTLFDQQWHLKSWNGPELVYNADVSAKGAWDITRGSRDIVVALIDDGFDLSHPDFSIPGKVVHPKDYVDGDANPFPVTSEGDYHGTPCAGVAIAEENGQGVVGIAPGCAFMPVRFSVGADDNQLWEIFHFVGQHADVISCSWGPPPAYAPLHRSIADKFEELASSGGPRKKGCVIVFASGNYNAPLDDPENTGFVWRHPYYGLVRTMEPILNGYCTHPDVIAVSSSTSLNKKAAYSNWGKQISVCAPSNNFHPLDRFEWVPGRGILTTDNEEFGDDFTEGSRYTEHFGGTSSAAPLTAGVAALVLSANPALTARQVKQILQETAIQIVDEQADPVLGLKKGTYDENGHSEWFGSGKIDAAKAVLRARELIEDDDLPVRLELGDSGQGNLETTDAEHFYKITVGDKLRVRLEGSSGQDFDLYIKQGAVPTTSDYDAVGFSPSADEQVIIDSAVPGDYYIMVRSYRGQGDYQLKVDLT